MHFSVIYFLKIVVDLFVSLGIFFLAFFHCFFSFFSGIILLEITLFRIYPFQELSFSGLILSGFFYSE